MSGAPRRAAGEDRAERRDLGRTSRTISPTAGPHYDTTGPEIWQQTDGKVDGFICAVGTGGTLAGVAMALQGAQQGHRHRLSPIRMGAALYRLLRARRRSRREGRSITEGIGQGRVTRIIEDAQVDKAYQIPDEEAVPIIFDLLEHEGLCLGGSSGINIAGAIRLAKELGPGHTIVTMLCDYGTRYQSKLFNPEFLRAKNLPVPAWLERRSELPVPYRKPEFVDGSPTMPTECLFRDDSYLRECGATRRRRDRHGGIVLDRTVFYATSGGQPGDSGVLTTSGGDAILIANANYTDAGKTEIAHVPASGAGIDLKVGDTVHAMIDWDRRYARMRMHTALHLLSAVLPYPVTGGSVGDGEGRLDFDIPEAGLDKDEITDKLARDDRRRRRGPLTLDHRRGTRGQARTWSRPCR